MPERETELLLKDIVHASDKILMYTRGMSFYDFTNDDKTVDAVVRNIEIISEAVATFGLVSVIWGCVRHRSEAVPFAVGAYITAAYWFTSSTSFANPAVTLARAVTDTFAGIRPADVPGFLAGQLIGALAATALFRWLAPRGS